jgi:hypothetical protein
MTSNKYLSLIGKDKVKKFKQDLINFVCHLRFKNINYVILNASDNR